MGDEVVTLRRSPGDEDVAPGCTLPPLLNSPSESIPSPPLPCLRAGSTWKAHLVDVYRVLELGEQYNIMKNYLTKCMLFCSMDLRKVVFYEYKSITRVA
jgi:hypothetical protein